jgi:hypothetical protein
VPEFGQALFGAAASPSARAAAGEPFPAEEVRAAEEFFHALRMLQCLVDG